MAVADFAFRRLADFQLATLLDAVFGGRVGLVDGGLLLRRGGFGYGGTGGKGDEGTSNLCKNYAWGSFIFIDGASLLPLRLFAGCY